MSLSQGRQAAAGAALILPGVPLISP